MKAKGLPNPLKRLKMPRRDRVKACLKALSSLRFEVSHASLLRWAALSLTLLIAMTVRLLPIRWAFYLSEFDPYYQYRLTRFLVKNGFASWTSWHDYMGWYPYGRNVARLSFPGLPFTAATLYMILDALGIRIVLPATLDPLLSDPVFNFCVVFPVIMGTISCLAIYFLGKDIGGEAVGLFSALFLALNPAYIGRTSLGFFDDETVGIFGIILFFIFFLRAVEEETTLKKSLLYSVASGLFLGYITASWGAARYPIAMTVLFTFVLLLMRRYSTRLLISYSVTFGITLFICANVPNLGFRFLREASILPAYGVFLIMCVLEAYNRMKTWKLKVLCSGGIIAIAVVGFALLWTMGYVKPLGAKFISTLNPFLRTSYPLFESVAEHKPSAWATFYYDLGIGVLFLPLGIFFAVQMGTRRGIFLIIYGLTAIYFASTMIRLTLILAPAVSLLWALAIVRLARPFIVLLKEKTLPTKRRARFRARLGKEFSGAALIVIFMLLLFNFVIGTDFMLGPRAQGPRVFSQAYSPVTIASASLPVKPSSTVTDWFEALTWIREELPPSPPYGPTVIASWWDYGYWITAIGNKTSLADNQTFNWTQIKQIAKMFMSPVDESINILKKYNATHVLVFTSISRDGWDLPYGEAGKFKWMIRIAGLNESDFGQDKFSEGRSYWEWSSYGKNTTLYLMMTYGKYKKVPNSQYAQRQYWEVYQNLENFNKHFELVYYSKGKAVNNAYYALILIYEVKY
ncbi:MAG: hypothetical protein AYL32_005900 [Candidatus Bathyarchaeota archaeon B26-2]|nr:MAG: hypothetical protein AYL32_005900 [Candidatus Bathyarchaeota archaeon B26-2]